MQRRKRGKMKGYFRIAINIPVVRGMPGLKIQKQNETQMLEATTNVED